MASTGRPSAKPRKIVIGGGKVEKDESEVRWLISYSDFMMQLVCLFILLYSVSTLDKGKMAVVAAYYRASIGLGQPPVQEPFSRGRNLAVGDAPLVTAPEGRVDLPPDVRYRIEQVPLGWRVRFNAPVFAPGSAELSAAVRSDLDAVAGRFRAYAGTVAVAAFAAPAPADAAGPDALKLAQQRAEAVVSHLTREGFDSALDARFVSAAGQVTAPAEARRVEIHVRVK
jgi:flagellar motor protein MotB